MSDKNEILWFEFSKEIQDCKCDLQSLSYLIQTSETLIERFRVKDKKETTVFLLSKVAEECMEDDDEEEFFKMLKNGTIDQMIDAVVISLKAVNKTKKRCCIIL